MFWSGRKSAEPLGHRSLNLIRMSIPFRCDMNTSDSRKTGRANSAACKASSGVVKRRRGVSEAKENGREYRRNERFVIYDEDLRILLVNHLRLPQA
jgi:hypothetical protein